MSGFLLLRPSVGIVQPVGQIAETAGPCDVNDGCHSLSCGADSQIVVENVEGELQVGRGGGAHFQVFVSTSAADYCAALKSKAVSRRQNRAVRQLSPCVVYRLVLCTRGSEGVVQVTNQDDPVHPGLGSPNGRTSGPSRNRKPSRIAFAMRRRRRRQRCTPQLCKVFLESHRALTIARSVSLVQDLVMTIKITYFKYIVPVLRSQSTQLRRICRTI